MPYRRDDSRVWPATEAALISEVTARTIEPEEARWALALIVARGSLGSDATQAHVEALAEETLELLAETPLLDELLRP